MSIHATIRSNRLRLGMTEQQLADQVGVTRAAVQQWEREGGTAPPHQPPAEAVFFRPNFGFLSGFFRKPSGGVVRPRSSPEKNFAEIDSFSFF